MTGPSSAAPRKSRPGNFNLLTPRRRIFRDVFIVFARSKNIQGYARSTASVSEQLRLLRLVFRIGYRARILSLLQIQQLLPDRGCLRFGSRAAAQLQV